MNIRMASVVALVACAISDLAAVPLVLGSGDAPALVGVGLGLIGVLTAVAAFGVARGARWSRPLAFGTRLADVAGVLPVAMGGVDAPTLAAAAVTVALSLLAVATLLRSRTVRSA